MGLTLPANTLIAWQPASKPQAALLACPVFEIFFGGARGSLKTDGMLGEFAYHADRFGEHAIGLMVRRERTQLMETYERAQQIYKPLGFKFNDSDKVARGPTGARLRFAYLERDADAEAYQGHSYTRVYVEEIGNFPNSGPVLKLMATLRSPNGVPVGFRASGNPGGPGHQWVKARYIDDAPLGWKVRTFEYKNPFNGDIATRDRVFIPGKITDHNLLGPEYIAQLQMSGSETLVRAWLLGDWNVIQGAFFPEFDITKHVIRPMALPEHWLRFRAMDWGSAKPFSVGWYAVSDGELAQFPRGALIKYREWYGMKPDEPNIGLQMTAEQVGQGIKERETDEKIGYGVLDPSAFQVNGGPSIAERMFPYASFRPADNKRVAQAGALSGWDQVRSRLVGEDERPMLYFFETCTNTIRTLPALQHDPDRAEDVDTDGEDHAPDETRYACMSRPYVRAKKQAANPTFPSQLTYGELLKWSDAKQTARRRI